MFLLAYLLKNPTIGMLIWLLNAFEYVFLGPGLVSVVLSVVGGPDSVLGKEIVALFEREDVNSLLGVFVGFLVFADTFLAYFLYSFALGTAKARLEPAKE